MKEKIIKKIEDYHRKQGIAFLSTKDAEDYFKGLVDLIESIIQENALV